MVFQIIVLGTWDCSHIHQCFKTIYPTEEDSLARQIGLTGEIAEKKRVAQLDYWEVNTGEGVGDHGDQ